MTILILGDSHSDPFVRLPNVSRCDLSVCNPWLFTTHRFTDPTDTDLWNTVDSWFSKYTIHSNEPSKILIITGGEIDIRAHFWKHIPRHYKKINDITDYIRNNALTFFKTLELVCKKYKLEHVVVWSSPVAGEKAQYNSTYPFSGSSVTRNKLIHMWNVEFANLIIDANKFSLASAYYNFINLDYTTSKPNPSHDGVHWHDKYGPIFWKDIILPAIENKGLHLDQKWNLMYKDKFDISEEVSNGEQLYDSWVRTDQIKNLNNFKRVINIKDNNYAWIAANYRSLLPDHYTELGLIKI